MVKFKGYLNPHGQLYLPSEIRAELNTKKIEMLGNTKAIVLFPENTDPAVVLRSLKVIMSDLRHRLELERKKIK